MEKKILETLEEDVPLTATQLAQKCGIPSEIVKRICNDLSGVIFTGEGYEIDR